MAQVASQGFSEFLKTYSTTLKKTQTKEDLFQAIVDTPFRHKDVYIPLGLSLMVLALVNDVSGTLDRTALSNTEPAKGAVDYSVMAFHDIKIPLSAKQNMLIKTLTTGRWHQTDDWAHTFTPALTPEEARFNQAGAGVACTIAYPINVGSGAILSFSYFKPLWEIGEEQHIYMKKCVEIAQEALQQIWR